MQGRPGFKHLGIKFTLTATFFDLILRHGHNPKLSEKFVLVGPLASDYLI